MSAALEVIGLSKRFGGLPAVDAVTVIVPQGDRRLLLGPNGAGKTTLFNLVTGDLAPMAGTVRLLGRDITGLPPYRCAQYGLARTYQILTLFPNSTLEENVILALLGLLPVRWNPLAQVRGHAQYRERALAALDRVGLAKFASRRLGETSYGEKRRLEVALALVQAGQREPRLRVVRVDAQGAHEAAGRLLDLLAAFEQHAHHVVDVGEAAPGAEQRAELRQCRFVVAPLEALHPEPVGLPLLRGEGRRLSHQFIDAMRSAASWATSLSW